MTRIKNLLRVTGEGCDDVVHLPGVGGYATICGFCDILSFCGSHYYPEGGADDFRRFGTMRQLKQTFERFLANEADQFAFGHIVDTATMTIITSYYDNGKWIKN